MSAAESVLPAPAGAVWAAVQRSGTLARLFFRHRRWKALAGTLALTPYDT